MIRLEFHKEVRCLAGYHLGLATFKEQIHGDIDFTKPFTIVFPERIGIVSTSFIQGFFHEVMCKVDVETLAKNMKVVSEVRGLKHKILEELR